MGAMAGETLKLNGESRPIRVLEKLEVEVALES